MTTATFNQVLENARQLSRYERARLITQLAEELVEQPSEAPVGEAWRQLFALLDEISETPYHISTPVHRLKT
jgi:hypothetical protein